MKFGKLALASVSVISVLVAGCGGGGGGGSSGGTSTPSTTPTSTPTTYTRFAFASNGNDGTVSVYSVDADTGALRQRSYVSTGANNTRNLALDPTARFLFVSMQGSANGDGFQAFPFDAATGRLGTPVSTTSYWCGTPYFDAAGKYMYCSYGNFLFSFSIGNDGSLTELPGSPLGAPTDNWYPSIMTMSPSGKFIVAADSNLNQLLSFEINPADGTIVNSASLVPSGFLSIYANPTAVVVDPTGKYVYVAHDGGVVSAYSLNATTGALAAIDADESQSGVQAATVGNGANDLAFDPSGTYLYVANTTDQTISAFRLNAATGALAPLAGSPFAAGVALNKLAIEPTGKYLYSIDTLDNRITTFAIDAGTGALTKASRTVARQNPTTLAFSKGTAPVTDTPKAAYVTNRNSNTISQFTIGSTGAVTPMSTASVATGANPRSITVDAFGRFAYVAGYSDNTVSAYVIDPTTKALSPAQGTQANGGVSPTAIAADPSGRFVFAANYGWPGSGTVSAYTINTASGTLTEVAGSPFVTANGSVSLTVDPTGRFLYVANQQADTVTAFYIRPTTGVLSRIDADAVTAGTQDFAVTNARPISIATDPTGRFLYLATACGGNWVFSINATTGALTRVDADLGGLCGAFGGTANLTSIDPTGHYLYTADYTMLDALGAYGIDTSTGALSAIAGSPYSTGTGTTGTTVDASGRYVYAAGSAGLYGFRIGSGGALTAIAAPVAAEGSPSSVATIANIQ